jgi:hypothetical protein
MSSVLTRARERGGFRSSADVSEGVQQKPAFWPGQGCVSHPNQGSAVEARITADAWMQLADSSSALVGRRKGATRRSGFSLSLTSVLNKAVTKSGAG